MAKNLDVISTSTTEQEDEYELYISEKPIQISCSALDWATAIQATAFSNGN